MQDGGKALAGTIRTAWLDVEAVMLDARKSGHGINTYFLDRGIRDKEGDKVMLRIVMVQPVTRPIVAPSPGETASKHNQIKPKVVK